MMRFIYLFFMVVLFIGCGEKDKLESFRIGTNVWPGYEPLHLAKLQNEYRENIDVIRYGSSTVVLNKFRNKEIEAAALTLDEVVILKDQGYDPYIIAVLDISDGADVLLSTSTINSIQELKGKSIGVENTALGSYMLARILEIAGLKRDDIQLVPLGVNQHAGAFKDSVVDAVITFEPVRSELIKFGAKEIFTSREIAGEIVDVLVVRKEFASSEYVKDILQAWSAATQKIRSKDSEAISLVAKRLNQTSEEFINSLDGLTIPTLEKSNDMIKGSSLDKTLENIQDVMLQKNLIKNKVDTSSILH